MRIHKRNKRYCFKEDRLELFFFVNVEINPTVTEMRVIMGRFITYRIPGEYFSR